MRLRSLAIVAIALAFASAPHAAVAQPTEAPAAPPTPVPVPSLPAAGVIPSSIWLTVTGSPADGTFLDQEIRDALDRQIRPTLRPGSGIRYGPIVPWPLLPVASGDRAAVNVTITIAGDDTSTTVSGVTTVNIVNVAMPLANPSVLFLSDDPEYLPAEGLVFRGYVTAEQPARLYYYHDDVGIPRDLDVVLSAKQSTRVHIIRSLGGPDLDVMTVGHVVSRDFLLFRQQNEGTVVVVAPGQPFILHHDLILQGELVAGAVDVQVLSGGPVAVSVIASQAGGHPERYLDGPRVPYDGHNRHGIFQLDGYGAINSTYTIGGPDAAVKYGSKSATPRNLDPSDPGRDYGDYGVVHRITFGLVNPTDVPHPVYLYERPLGGPVRSTFLVDGQLKELGCVRLPQPYWFMTYRLPPHSNGESTTLTMTDGGSYYPIEFGITETQPVPNTPPVGAFDGCSPTATPAPAPPAPPPPPIQPASTPAPATTVAPTPGPTAVLTTAPAPTAAPGATPPPNPRRP